MAGDLPKQKQKIMNDKNLDRQADNMLDNVNETISLLVRKIEELEQDLIDLEKQHEQSLKVAFEKGYEEGVKYTDGLISEEKKFPF
jgi:archaellum component FlaC